MSDEELRNPDSPPSENEGSGRVLSQGPSTRQQTLFTIGRESQPNELVSSENVSHRASSRRSITWVFWEHPKTTSGDIDKTLVQCKLCGIKNKFYHSTTMLLDHLKRCHYNALSSASSSSSTPRARGRSSTQPGSSCTTGTASTSKTIDSYFQKADKYKRPSKRSDDIDRALAYAVIRDLLPISECCGEGLSDFAAALDPRYVMPSDKYIKNSVILPMYYSTKQIIKEELADCDCLCMTTDTWSSLAKQSYISLTVHFITHDTFELKSYLLETRYMPKSHTSEHLIEIINEMIEEWGISDKHITFVTDNARDIKRAICDLSNYMWIGCFAHTLNLSIGKALKVVRVKNTVTRCKKIVNYFGKSNNATRMLKEEEAKLGMIELLTLNYCKTRWNSINIMFERVIRILPPVCSTLVICNRTDLIPNQTTQGNMIQLSELLGVFEAATIFVSAQKVPTISLVKPMIESFSEYLKICEGDSTMIKKAKTAIKDDFQTRYQTEKIQNLISISCLLDPRFKDREDTNTQENHELVINETIRISSPFQNQSDISLDRASSTETQVSSSHNVQTMPSENKFTKLRNLLFKPNNNRNNTAGQDLHVKINSEFTRYMSEPTEPEEANPLDWWRSRSSVYPNLSKTVRHYLCIQPTSVPSERAFSLTGNIITKKRTRLLPENVNMLSFLHANYSKIPPNTPIHFSLN